MIFIYLLLIIIATLLLALAVESILKSTTMLNFAAAGLLALLAVLAAMTGLRDYFALLQEGGLALLSVKIQNAAFIMFGPAFLFFSTYFPRDEYKKGAGRVPAAVLTGSAVFALIIMTGAGISRFSLDMGAHGMLLVRITYNPLHYLGMLSSTAVLIYSLVQIFFRYRHSGFTYQKKQAYYFFIGLAGFILLTGASVAASLLKARAVMLVLAGLAYLLLGSFLLYAVINYRFINIRRQLLRFGRDTLISLIVSLPVVAILFLFRVPLAAIPQWLYFVVAIPALVLFFTLFSLLSRLLRRMMGLEGRSKDDTEAFLDRIGLAHNINELAQNVLTILANNIHCRNADFLFFDRDREVFTTVASLNGRDYSIPAFDPIFRYFSPDGEILEREAVHVDPSSRSMRSIAERYFETYQTALVLPFYFEGSLAAFINMDRKLDNNTFTRSDMLILYKLAKVVRIYLSNIILFEKDEEARRTKRDLQLAANIQETIFQRQFPEFSVMDVFGYLKPAKWVSGDYLLIQKAGEDKAGFVVADVSGKGVSAALISMMIHSVARSQDFASTTTNAIVTRINEVMAASESRNEVTRLMSFATVFCGYLDQSSRTLYYTNAGHNPLFVLDPATGETSLLKAHAVPAGIFPDTLYPTESFQLRPGMILAIYSDGITEAINSREEEFGTERLYSLIRRTQNRSARHIGQAVLDALYDFTNDLEQFDDITLIIIKC